MPSGAILASIRCAYYSLLLSMDINQLLRERKAKKKEYLLNKRLRAKRQFKHKRQQYIDQLQEKATGSQANQRRMDFYNSVFEQNNDDQPQQPYQSPKEVKRQRHQQMFRQREAEKQQRRRSKQTNKKLIKKMKKQKTRKGQPIMKNYLDYALFKLEQEGKEKKVN